jgi:HK97 family phage major capsid protein
MRIQEMQVKRNKLLTDMQAIAVKGFTAESRTAFDKMNTEVITLEGDIQRAQAVDKFESEQRAFSKSPRGAVGSDNANETRSQINRAFRAYARTGVIPAEHRDLLTTSDSTGGALIPQLFDGVLREAVKFYGPIASKVTQKVTDNNGAPLKISLANDTSHGLTLLATEGSSSPVETDPSFASAIISVDTVTGGLCKVSFQELEDSSFDLDTWLRTAFGVRYARGLETAVTLGKDSAGTTLPSQTAGGLAAVAKATVATTTASLAAGIGWDDLVSTFAALDPAYQVNAEWVMNANTRSYLLGLKDGFGRPYFTPDPSGQNPFTKILGYNIVLDQAITDNVGVASASPIWFGDLARSYMLRTDGQPSILRLNERYADTLEVGFMIYGRHGGISLNAGVAPIVSLKQASA